MTTPPGPGFPGGPQQPGQQPGQQTGQQPGPQQGQRPFQSQGQQPFQPQFQPQGQPGQPQQFPQAPGFPPGTGHVPPAAGQPQQFPQAPLGSPVKKKSWVRYLVAALSTILVIGIVIGVKVVIGLGVGAAVDSTNAAHNTAVGDCATVTGTTAKPHYEKVDCGSGKENYTVGSVLPSSTAKCPEDYDEYYETNAINPVKLCLIPAFVDGSCYKFDVSATEMGYPKVACTGSGAVQVKVIKGSTDKSACGADGAAHALAYPETKTTICLMAPTGS